MVLGLQGSNAIGVDLFPKDGIKELTGQANLTLDYTLQLTLATSFRGDDLLLTGFQTGNTGGTSGTLFTNMGRLASESGLNNQLVISDLSYRFALGRNLGIIIGPAGVNPENVFRGISPLEGYADAALSRFGQRNPILSLGNTTGGAGFDWQITPRISLQGVYSASNPAIASDQTLGGLFGGSYTAETQLSLAPTKAIDVIQDELVLKGNFNGTVTNPATGKQYQGTFEFKGQGPRYSAPNGGTSPTVFDFQSHYQGTAPKIPAQVTITRYTITAVPLSLTLTVPSTTTNPTQPNPPINPSTLQPIGDLGNTDAGFFEINRGVFDRQQAPIGP